MPPKKGKGSLRLKNRQLQDDLLEAMQRPDFLPKLRTLIRTSLRQSAQRTKPVQEDPIDSLIWDFREALALAQKQEAVEPQHRTEDAARAGRRAAHRFNHKRADTGIKKVRDAEKSRRKTKPTKRRSRRKRT